MAYLLGIDLGTSGVKAGVLNSASTQLECIATRDYDDSSEQDPGILWNKTLEVVKESVGLLGNRESVLAIGLSGQMHGAVLYDAQDRLISPIINWKDKKYGSPEIIEKIKLIFGRQACDELGTNISAGFSGAILFGIKESAPAWFSRIARFILPTDFLRGKLLGKSDYVTDQTNAFGTGLFNTRLNAWHIELIRKLQLPLNIFPEVHETSEIAGELSDDVADSVGLKRGIPIIYGGGDNPLSMLGSGLINGDSPMLVNIGTAAQISKVITGFHTISGLDTRSFFQGYYALVGASLAGGGSYQWLREELGEEGKQLDFHNMDMLAAEVNPGADGLVFCDGPSRQNPNRRRGFFGNMSRMGNVGHRARAVMEGVLMDLYDFYEVLRIDDNCDFIAGAGKGLQRSHIWPQICADFLGKPVRMTDFENAVFGAALMAASGIGAFGNMDEAVRSIKYASETIPEPTRTDFYQKDFVHSWRAKVKM
jgi:xylulokinase